MLENGVDLERFSPAPWPAPPASDGEPLRLVFVGRLVPFKGVGMLIDAVARLTQEIPIRLTIVGEGPMGAEWRDQAARRGIAERVQFAGNLSPPQVADAMRSAHLFCLPSVRESGGAVLLEAMACARPVVAVGFGGPAEIVDEEVGRLLPATDSASVIEGLVATFRDLLREPEVWRHKGAAGRARVEARYSWDAKVDSAIALYRDLMEPPSGGRPERTAR
jgi:glycosyltransferase involved in cell wall biosynthesis